MKHKNKSLKIQWDNILDDTVSFVYGLIPAILFGLLLYWLNKHYGWELPSPAMIAIIFVYTSLLR